MVAVRNEGWGTTQERMSLALCGGQPARQRLVLPDGCAVSDDVYAARGPGAVGMACRGGADGDGVLLPVVFRDRPPVLCRQLRLRGGCPVLARDLSTDGDPGRVGDGSTRPLDRACRASTAGVAGADGGRRVSVPVVVFAGRSCDHRRSVGRASGRAVREVPRARPSRKLVRADPQSGDVSGLGRQCRADVAGGDERSVFGRSRHALHRTGSICTGISGATCRIRFSGRSVPRSSSSDRPSACASTANRTSTTSCTVSRARVDLADAFVTSRTSVRRTQAYDAAASVFA